MSSKVDATTSERALAAFIKRIRDDTALKGDVSEAAILDLDGDKPSEFHKLRLLLFADHQTDETQNPSSS